jgi:hypothetical protein
MSHPIILGVVLLSTASRCEPAFGQDKAPVGVGSRATTTLTGCSGKSIEEYGIPRDVYGTWMGRSSWDDLAKGNWLMVEDSGVPRWRRDHFDRALDVGVPLVPTDSGRDLDELLKQAASGTQDATYRSLGKCLADYGSSTVFARLWWEFNMPPARQDPKRFVAAWRRAVPLIREGFRGAARPGQTLEIVWCTNAGAPDPEPFYPGDDVVDLIGSDVYGWVWGDSDPTVPEMLDRIRKGPYMLGWLADFANRHEKPTCLGEWGNVARKGGKSDESHGAGDCPEYIDAIYDWMKACKYGCRYVCYYNLAGGGVDITLDQTPAAVARLKLRAARAREGSER